MNGRKTLVSDNTYDTHGNVTLSTSYWPDGTINQKVGWESSYDGQGRLTKRLYFNAAGELTNTGVYTYPKERTVELVQINPDGSINHNAIQLYDAAGNMVALSRQYARGGTYYETNAYDEKGNRIEYRSYDENLVLTNRQVTKYDQYGNITESTLYKSDGKVLQTTPKRTLECDKQGNIVRVLHLSRNGSVTSEEAISYVFDDHGNWTRKTTAWKTPRGPLPVNEIIERTITYY